MSLFAIYDTNNGRIVRMFSGPEPFFAPSGEAAIAAEPGVTDSTHYVDMRTHTLVALPARPYEYMSWDFEHRRHVDLRPLAEAKAARWEVIKRARDQAEWGGFNTGFGRFDSDPASQGKLTGVITAAQINPNLSVDWTLANNTVVTLNGPDLVLVGLLLMQHVNAVHQRGRVLRQRIETAITNAQLEGITWTT